ncbi:MAG: hypothetical protein IPP47_30320 [Bryobacterales bacterium]|nr:hypothetical protein [Bryobacterales bacterium]
MLKRMSGGAGCVAAGIVMLVMAAAPAQAQGRVRVNIPFPFEAGTETLPAGQYVFERSGLAGTALMQIHNVEQNRTTTFVTVPVNHPGASSNPRLMFEVLGGTYRLAELWTAGAESGALVPRSKEQTLIAKQEGKVRTVALLLRTGTLKAR